MQQQSSMSDKIEIPKGQTREEVKIRKKFIIDFYAKWNAEHPDKQIYNNDLQDFINVRFLSIQETAEHASLRYESTLAITYLTEILEFAVKIAEDDANQNKRNQKQFKKVIIMEYQKENFGKIKMTVGVLKSNEDKIQYCITAI
jgi:hypothetical protein